MIVRTGFGAVDPTAQAAIGTGYGIGTSAATPAVAGAVASTVGISASLAIPIVGAAFAGIALAIRALLNSGCGQTCVVTSNWANQAEALLKKNLAAYLALPTPRAASAQAAYLANFDAIWAELDQACSNPQLGGAGKNCIADRQAGGCKWKTSAGGWSGDTYTVPGAAGSGTNCWNWFIGYRDPIANDPNVVPDSAASTVTSAFAGAASTLGISPWLLAGVVLLVVGLGAAAS